MPHMHSKINTECCFQKYVFDPYLLSRICEKKFSQESRVSICLVTWTERTSYEAKYWKVSQYVLIVQVERASSQPRFYRGLRQNPFVVSHWPSAAILRSSDWDWTSDRFSSLFIITLTLTSSHPPSSELSFLSNTPRIAETYELEKMFLQTCRSTVFAA